MHIHYNMNQQNSRLYLIVMVVHLFSVKSISLPKTEPTTSMIHTSPSTENEMDMFTELSAAVRHHSLQTTNRLTSQPSMKKSLTTSQNSSVIKIVGNIYIGNIPNTSTKANENPWKRMENSTSALISSSSIEHKMQSISESTKLIAMIFLPILVLLLLGLVIAILLSVSCGKRRINNDVNCESPTSPKFEEDVASVMEVEMEEVNRWMGSMKETTHRSLLDVSEEKN
ncbi:transmembrane protein 154 [Narcine bancroftii]|uniref:transmembrane protein 154 n=1 Tax=Narcine bancroftii TaxID=1343680 RepID=UPI003832083E